MQAARAAQHGPMMAERSCLLWGGVQGRCSMERGWKGGRRSRPPLALAARARDSV